MSHIGAAPRAAVPVSNARAAASRRNGAKSRGPKTPAGKARSSRNALKHGLRAVRHLVLAQEDAAAFADLQRALFAELAPVGALQTALARRIAIAAWRLERADRMEAEALEFRSYDAANPGLALMRDGNGTRTIETLLRYRNAAMAELTRCLRTLQALQAEAGAGTDRPAALPAVRRARRPRAALNEPDKARPINGLPANGAANRRPDASAPGHPAAGPTMPPTAASSAKPAREGTTAQPRNPPRRSRHDAPHRDGSDAALAALPVPVAVTKRTRETTAKQHLGFRQSVA